jgi:signal transduction histidine kinase
MGNHRSLTNIAKHAQATRVAIRLDRAQDQILMDIQDNGLGFSLPKDWVELAHQGHLGLVGIRERAEAIGGMLEIRSKPGQGTTIHIKVPLKPANG